MADRSFCICWNWEHDAGFVRLLEVACAARGMGLIQVTPANLADIIRQLREGWLTFDALLDRASDTDERFLEVMEWAGDRGIFRINPYERARLQWDKASVHIVLSRATHTPRTIILPSFDREPELPPIDLAPLGESFCIKPALGGGGDGVVVGATTLDEVVASRQEFAADRYLLQSMVRPVDLDGRPGWFRVIHFAGRVFPFWWDPRTHIYIPVTAEEESAFGLGPLRSVSASIAWVCGLELFSSEIARTQDDLFVAVDYVNDPVDLRLQSETPDGVPDALVAELAAGLAELARTRGPHL
jgi:hypothetical protein